MFNGQHPCLPSRLYGFESRYPLHKKLLTNEILYDIIFITYCGVEQVVARLVHIQEVIGSTPISAPNGNSRTS